MAKKRKKRSFELDKRCRCTDWDTCGHAWWMRVFAGGKRQRVNLTERYRLSLSATREDVEQWAAKAKYEARRGLLTNATSDTRLTFGDVADRFMAAHPNRHHYYLVGLRQSVVPAAHGASVRIEEKPIADVTTADIKHAVATWRTRKRTRAGAKGGAVAERHLVQVGRHVFTWAIKEGFCKTSPFYSDQRIPIIEIKGTKGRKRRLQPGEGERILTNACAYVRDFFTALLETACRPGELRTLQWSEVRGEWIVLLASKTKDREEREVFITPTLREILDRRSKGPDGAALASDRYVFGNEVGEELSRRRLCTLWLATCERAQVSGLHLHDLRREAGSQLKESGVDVHVVRDILGHSSITMTNTYLGESRTRIRQAFKQRHAKQARASLSLAHAGQSGRGRKSS